MLDTMVYWLYATFAFALTVELVHHYFKTNWSNLLAILARYGFLGYFGFSVLTMKENFGEFAVAMWNITQTLNMNMQILAMQIMGKSS